MKLPLVAALVIALAAPAGVARAQMLPAVNPNDPTVSTFSVLGYDPETAELTLTELHPGVELEQAVAATGWKLKVAADLGTTPAPTEQELTLLRELEGRTGVAAPA